MSNDIYNQPKSVVDDVEKILGEGKSSTGYELFHKTLGSAIDAAISHAKTKFGITISDDERMDKVGMGPRKPSNGKTNSYRLMGTDKNGKTKGVQVQVANLDNKRYELNMYKEETEVIETTGRLDEEIEGLKNKAKKSGMPYGILKKVYDRGMAAWKSGHRPGTTPQQWAMARVNSFTTKSSGTWGGADKDLASKVKGESVELDEYSSSNKMVISKSDIASAMKKAKANAKPKKEAADDQTKRLSSPLQKARLDKEKNDRDRDGKLKKTFRKIRKENDSKGPCWNGYKQVGIKMKDGKEVPNCVPESVEFNEGKMSPDQIEKLKQGYESLRGKKISAQMGMKISRELEKLDKSAAMEIAKADIPFVSTLAINKLMMNFNMSGSAIRKLIGESVEELVELTKAEKDLISKMYDKKGNLTPLGQKVMDHGKKEEVEIDEASKEGTIRIIDLSRQNNPEVRKQLNVDKVGNKGYQVQRMTKGKFVNQGKPYKTSKDAEKVRKDGQHTMQFEYGNAPKIGVDRLKQQRDADSKIDSKYSKSKSPRTSSTKKSLRDIRKRSESISIDLFDELHEIRKDND